MNRTHKTDARAEMQQRREQFAHEVFSQYEAYCEDMLQRFFDYWTEPNKSRTKMRFEMQPTWDLNLRLKYWERNDEKFNHRFNQSPNHQITKSSNQPIVKSSNDRYAQRRRIEDFAASAEDYKRGF